tara:strand:+ start:303 stop:758 length:456 start_codon:yes stop_codon:yes gene_type:complete
MIISCEKCKKKFQISDELIPDTGRLLQCGSCSYQWHYNHSTNNKFKKKIENIEDVTPSKDESIIPEKNYNKKKTKIQTNQLKQNENVVKNKKKVGILSYIIVLIISLIALIVIADTFKLFIKSFIPNIDLYLLSLYESLIDIILFFKDLVK